MMKMMIVVIIAGGSGSRLWPLSTPDYPKHLLMINGDNLSLLQRTYERAKSLTDKIYVVTETSHVDIVKKQLPELAESSIICEPGRRGTANCLITALVKISNNHDHDEPIASFHADHYIRDVKGFEYTFRNADKLTAEFKRIVLIGVEPDYPSTGFGYIEKGAVLHEQPLVYNVDSFKEKPDFETAKSYLNSGNYLWNCGYFVASLNTFKSAMQTNSPELFINFNKLLESGNEDYDKTYSSFENMAIDYALIEKVPDLVVIPANFDWMDLGSFGDLSAAVGGDELGNSTHGNIALEEVENSILQNYEDKPMAVVGLDNIVVINNQNGILVARKDLAQKVGEISKNLKPKS